MTTFAEILSGETAVTTEEKIAHVTRWLKDEYGIKNVNDREVLLDLTDVHDQGKDSVHFGHPIISSKYGDAIVQIVFATGQWHLSFQKAPATQFTLVHPKPETVSWNSTVNRGAVGVLGAILKTGTLGATSSPNVTQINAPRALLEGNNVQLFIPEENTIEVTPSARSTSDFSNLGDFGGSGRTSVSINLDDLGGKK